MYLKSLELSGFKSFAKKTSLDFASAITAIVGPNGSGKSNVAEGFRFVLGEQSIKSLRGKRGEDLIFNGSASSSRANRGSVKLTFDNRKKLFDIDFDEVTIERVVHRDGINDYLINGSQVRLRDIFELLAKANIGASGHHIISQGEADRILSSSPLERKEMIEEALGLKIYQYKKEEAEKKLGKTKENIKEATLVRKEVAPHLKFLKGQIDRLEKALAMQDELGALYREYLARESSYLSHGEKELQREAQAPEAERVKLERDLARAKEALARASGADAKRKEILLLEGAMERARLEKEKLSRELGRLEGQIEYAKREEEARRETGSRDISAQDLERLLGELEGEAAGALGELSKLSSFIKTAFARLRALLSGEQDRERRHSDTERLVKERLALEEKLSVASKEEEKSQRAYEGLRTAIEAESAEGREAERLMFQIVARQGEVRGMLQALGARGERLKFEREEFKRELAEAIALVGRGVSEYEKIAKELPPEERSAQEMRRRAIEKLKIRLEEFGAGSGEEIRKEYKEVSERDTFLAREIEDLEKSAASLLSLIEELEEKLAEQFKDGMKKINEEFKNFFALMFGSGTASLSLVKVEKRIALLLDEETGESVGGTEVGGEADVGIDIHVTIPHKRIKGLHMLSGGERALTSIALIFAMSQVNPPPFLILDETDAALDEANSRRYGDMIESLSKSSQLILITHNRETMSRAGVLYGVTMAGDGISKLLSVKFDEAVAVAK